MDTASPKTKIWKENIEKLLYKSNVCGICLSVEEDLDNLNTIYYSENNKKERKLKDILGFTFGNHLASQLPTHYICEPCVTTILQSYFIVKKIRSNHAILQKYIDILTHQAMVSSITEQPIEKQLLLTIDNVNSLNIPVTVTKKDKENNITQIFLCEVDATDAIEPEFELDNDQLKYECPYCGKQYQEFVIFKDHYNLHNEVYFRCHKCAKRYKYFKELIGHRNKKHLDGLTVCNVCEIILLNPESNEHEIDHPNEYTCVICDISFQTQDDFQIHNIEVHPYVSCPKCSKVFSNYFKLEHHRCPYKCSECKEECVHEKYLDSYKEMHMAKSSVFKCPDCDFLYTTKCQIVSHANEEHLNHLPYLCDSCGESFASGPHLTLHISKIHADVSQVLDEGTIKVEGPIVASVLFERPFECDLCGFCLNSEESYTAHRRKHLTNETQCRICKRVFNSIGQLNVHIKNKHPDENPFRNITYRCTMCPSDFKLRTELLKHITTHPKDTPHTCRQCNECYFSKKNYISHVRKHRIKYDKSCPICLKKYTKHTISRHMRLHLDQDFNDLNQEANMKCDVCGGGFPTEKDLIKHADSHEEQRECPHCMKSVNSALYSKHVSTHVQNRKHLRECSDCNYTTKFAVCLEAHINRHHLKIRPYVCELCNKTFYSDYTLKGHKATHKEERPEHYCHICGKKFISQKALTFHTRIHTGEQPYPCDLCDLSFLSASRRRQHMVRKHYDPQFECQICLKKLYTQSDLKRHVGDCHDGQNKRKKAKKESLPIEQVSNS